MCGISGLINLNKSPVNIEFIRKINNKAEYRGPDAENYFLKENLALGHRRLSIIDLNQTAHQPMIKNYDDINNLAIVFNGEIFNYLEIKSELTKKGIKFTTNSDTEVILAAYAYWGGECVNYFNGMWAFAIYNQKTNILFCSRDRFGIKPFYYVLTNEYFAFASEIKQLLELQDLNKVNFSAVSEFILGFEDYKESTFYRDINKLPIGNNLLFDLNTNKYSTDKYYEIPRVDLPRNKEEVIDNYFNLFSDSVLLRLRSDVLVGTCLSGGLDSSAVAAIASKNYSFSNNQKFQAIHAKSFEKKTDESFFANEVASFCDIDLYLTEPDTSNFSDVLEKVFRIQDEPFGGPSIVMQYFVFQEAAKRGLKVMLDGQGGDETLLGYDSYQNMYLSSIPFFKSFLKFLKLDKQQNLNLNLTFASSFKSMTSLLKQKKHLSQFNFIKRDYFDLIDYDLVVDKALESCSSTFSFQKYNMEHVLEKLLRFEDRNSMFHSIEARLPFLDHRLVEFSLNLPLNLKINKNETKYVLRKSLQGKLPNSVVNRTDKKGFEAPSAFWKSFDATNQKSIKNSPLIQTITSGKIPTDFYYTWRLGALAAWERIYNMSL